MGLHRFFADVAESCFRSICEVLLTKILGWKVRGVCSLDDLSASSSDGRLVLESKLSLWLKMRLADLF